MRRPSILKMLLFAITLAAGLMTTAQAAVVTVAYDQTAKDEESEQI